MIGFLVLALFSFSAMAAPGSIEVWFLSNAKVTEVQKLLDRPQYVYKKKTAELECQEMGDFCFDPQFGLYKKGDVEEAAVADEEGQIEKVKAPEIPGARSVDRDLITCDKNNYFDIFCGKARAEAKNDPKLDLWIDTSSSVKEFDFIDSSGGCYRKSLVKRLDETCGFNQKVNVMMFDVSIKQAGTMDSLCNNQGLNDVKKLMDWIERSTAKKLVIITDIYEFHKDFADYIESKHGTFRGDKDALRAQDLMNLVDELEKSCR
jgi:hypothetical protein